jgi:putative restriction endonuclease
VRGVVWNTDYDWYSFLAANGPWAEVNFWLPSDTRHFRMLRPGEPFFFKLKKPHYAIAGFGLYARWEPLPDWLAWECFGPANGTPDFATMRARIRAYRSSNATEPRRDGADGAKIGCILLANPIFFPRDRWVRQPSDWAKFNLRGKGYDLATGEGNRIWSECRERARDLEFGDALVAMDSDEPVDPVAARPRYGAEQVIRPRLGQGIFRVAVTQAYEGACAVTTEHSLPVLEAAHIRPYADGGEHHLANGLLLRSDVHRLFDLGYVTVTPTGIFEVSRQLRDDYANGKVYYEMHGRPVRLPQRASDRPDPTLLDWHASERFLG